jgi:hypothetical protein
MLRRIEGLFGAVVVAGAIAASPLFAQERGTSVVADRPARVFVMASFGADCAPAGRPELTIDQAPAKGAVTFKEGQTTTIQYSLSGKCIGARVEGTGIYYTARVGETGSDAFIVSARLPSGEIATRTFRVTIAE